MRLLKKTYNRELLDFIAKYRADHGDSAIDPNDIADSAIKAGLNPRRPSPKTLLARDFAKAMKQITVRDPQGRTVREWYATRETTVDAQGVVFQHVMWDSRDTAKPKFMRTALQQQRQGLVHDALRLKDARDSYNDNNKHGATLPELNFDLRPDIEEAEQSKEYPDAAPDADVDED